MAKKAEARPASSAIGIGMSGPGRSEAGVIAFADFVGPEGTTWAVTIREGATQKMVSEMFELCLFAMACGRHHGFESVSRINEFGSKLTVSKLAANRSAKRLQAEQRAIAAKQRADATKNQPAASAKQAPKQAPKQPVKSPKKPTPQQGRGGLPQGWDLKKSPIAVGRLLVQGAADTPKVEMYSPNKKLKHPVFTVNSSVVAAIIRSWYTVEEDDLEHLFTVGKSMPVDWFVHWVPSPKNASWKDIADIAISKMSMLRRAEQVHYSADDPANGDDDFAGIPF